MYVTHRIINKIISFLLDINYCVSESALSECMLLMPRLLITNHKAAASQEPSILGHPRKCSGLLNVLQQHLTLSMLGFKFLGFWPYGLLEIFLRQQP